ncbi:MAG: hypothetical protein QOG53_3507 [Frankiales bacterium]|jgi:hypothetical protein|nr:hypothetical protein [Frankiales bacterium]
MANKDSVELTIRVSQESLSWAVLHINEFIAQQPVNTEPLAHEFVSALTNPLSESQRSHAPKEAEHDFDMT